MRLQCKNPDAEKKPDGKKTAGDNPKSPKPNVGKPPVTGKPGVISRVVKRCRKAIPFISGIVGAYYFTSDVEAKGGDGAAGNLILDSTPGVQWIKLGHELYTGEDWIPDLEDNPDEWGEGGPFGDGGADGGDFGDDSGGGPGLSGPWGQFYQ